MLSSVTFNQISIAVRNERNTTKVSVWYQDRWYYQATTNKARPIMEQARLDLDAKLLSAAKKLREYDQQDGDALLMWAKDYGYGTGSDTIETLLEILEG